LLARASLFDGKQDCVNRAPGELASVSPDDVKNFAGKHLFASNRTEIERDAAATPASDSEKQTGGVQ